MKTMAKTLASHLDGIVAYWNEGITSAAMEGFNNKIG
jgi:transposase